jgi:precorrin-6B methylase 2
VRDGSRKTEGQSKLKVTLEGPIKGLSFDGVYYQSKVDVDNPLTGHCEYVELFLQALLFNRRPKRILMLGLGGGSAQRLFHHYCPDARILTVEVDPEVVRIAREHFFFDDKKLLVVISDARDYLERTKGKFDIIIQDTFVSKHRTVFIPEHLASREFFELVWARLKSSGVFAINTLGTVRVRKTSNPIVTIYRDLVDIFRSVYLFEVSETMNVVMISPKRAAKGDIMQMAEGLPEGIRCGTAETYRARPCSRWL